MPNVDAISHDMLWTTLLGIILIFGLITVVLTAIEKIRAHRDYNKRQRELGQPGIADQISKKVLEQLEPRIHEIEIKLSKDKSRLDNHETMLQEAEKTNKEIRSGLRAYGKTMLILLNHGNLGDSKEVKEAADELNAFLADRI